MTLDSSGLTFEAFKEEVLKDYKLAWISRHMSLVARKEVLGGKAKFGIFGDGKEVAQLAMAKQFKSGDWRSGYYRDQTFLLAAEMTTPKIFFAQLYGETRTELNPDNGGRSFNNHFGTRLIDEEGNWKELSKMKCTASDISPTAGQMPRLVGLALASKLYRNNPELKDYKKFSDGGNEVAFGTIGDASTSEGHFFETLNAASVLQIPMAVSVWDDGYGISVPKEMQTVKASISKALHGFGKGPKDGSGMHIYTAKGWDYAGMCKMYAEGIELCRKEHVPVLFHVDELTQPIGHSTSGSHERYKTADRLEWEKEYDCLLQMKNWMLEHQLAGEDVLLSIEEAAYEIARQAQREAYQEFQQLLQQERDEMLAIVSGKGCVCASVKQVEIDVIVQQLKSSVALTRKEILSSARKILRNYCAACIKADNVKPALQKWVSNYFEKGWKNYSAFLYNEGSGAVKNIQRVQPEYDETPVFVPGREILRDNFEKLFEANPLIVTFGEDTGKLGGVNQTMEGMQEKFGDLRVRDTGIRETTILGKGIGLALRGLRPIAEIQYFDYLLYALQTMSDDLATTRYRTKNGQKAPVIVRTRGHRLEGIWHSGSPLSMVINSIRGIYVCVPRDMTRAAGFYNTLLEGDDPALVIEPLNGYRLREAKPKNLGEFKIPLGHPEVLRKGSDVTLVTYGSCVRIAQEACGQLEKTGISVELIDVQTLLPFDIDHVIGDSLKQTNRVVFFDEDVPGGATAFMMQKVLEEQRGFYHLDAPPKTITAKEHRPAYGTDGDYFSNPSAEDVYEAIYDLMGESDPEHFPPIYN
jgi:pyruvate/2-oxoglutarate/acetoin dehydrogenase E1 component/TPP-dependent pyruvate/acetoin dehydrogenase alpha subunit